jgi:dolichyl-phosphate mannosyltransferase polypeptide 2 regulatory subunit|tara:strand:+ start:5717 stop:5974 length:258 start_codon:yes stop_codon:yes gene_type:complete
MPTRKRYSPEAIQGIVIACLSTLGFLYLSVWLLFLPFIDDDHHVRKFFFPGEYKLIVNVLIRMGGVMIGLCGLTIGVALMKKKTR